MITVNIVDMRTNLSDIVNQVAYSGERVTLRRHSKEVAAIVSLEDLRILEELENREDLKAALKAKKEKGSVSLKEVKKRLGAK